MYIVVKIDKDEKILNILFQIDDFALISTLIKESVDKFNKLFKKENLSLVLMERYNNYCLKNCKKSGKPDNDLPKFDTDSTLKETNVSRYSLIYKPDDLILIQKIGGKCCSCAFF